MKQSVTLLIACLTVLTINGCGSDLIFGNCVTPDVKKPKVDNTRKNNMLDSTKQCIRNYLVMKQYTEELEEANRVCK